MRRGPHRHDRNLAAVSHPHHTSDTRAAKKTTTPAATPSERAGSTDIQAAEETAAKAAGQLAIAQTKFEEIEETFPPQIPGLVDAEKALTQARERAQRAAVTVTEAQRRVEDAEGELRVAETSVEVLSEQDREDKTVAAQERLAHRERALDSAREALLRAREDSERADQEFAGTEQQLNYLRDQPARESSKVVAAREALAAAERDYTRACANLEFIRDTNTPEPPEAAVPMFASVDTFVDRYVLPNWKHAGLGREARWCAKWWLHEEAVTRFEALWEAFEVMRREPAPSLSTFLRDHFDHHLQALTQPMGVFHGCNADTGGLTETVHRDQHVWAHDDPGPGMFEVDEQAAVQPRRGGAEEGMAS